MKKVIVLNKKEGETPLECLGRFRARKSKSNKSYKDIRMTYAGRLDPMASGLMLVLAGEEVKNKEKYLALDKEYEFEILFGFATDTYDILGKIVKQDLKANKDLKKEIKNNLKYFTGKFIQKYPVYSSKTVNGKQLFEYGRAGIPVDLPSREVFVKKLQFLKLRKISDKKLLSSIEKRIKNIKGDFRQKEILNIWHKHIHNSMPKYYEIGSLKIKCSSGTYVRGIADSLGSKIGIPTLAFSIKRTKIGKFGRIQ